MNGNDKLERYGKLLAQLGVPTVFAIALLWFVLMRLLTVLDTMMVDLRHQTKAIERIEAHVLARGKER